MNTENLTPEQKRILVLEQTLRVIRQAHPYDEIGRHLIDGALQGKEAEIPLPQMLEPRNYVAANLRALLMAVPEANTGDWYGQLLNWADDILQNQNWIPNQGPTAIRSALKAKLKAEAKAELRQELHEFLRQP